MANKRYPYSGELFATQQIDWVTDPIKCLLIGTTAYTYSDAHRYLSDVPAAARISLGGTLSGRTATMGVCDASDYSFGTLTGSRVDAAVILKDTGVEGTSPLIAYYDKGIGLNVNPSGQEIIVRWDNGTNKVFRL